MIYYLLAAIIPLACFAVNERWYEQRKLLSVKTKRYSTTLVVLAVLPMLLLYALRYKYIGVDTIGYVKFFQGTVRRYSFEQLMVIDDVKVRGEKGYLLYVKFISLFTRNYTVYLTINGVILFGILTRFAIKYTKNPFIFFTLFMALGTYSFFETGLRQSFAIVICLLAIDFVKKRRFIPFVLTVLLATTFHKSAFIFLMIYPLSIIKNYKSMTTVYVATLLIFVLGFTAFQGFFNQLLGYEYEIEETGNGGIFLILLLIIFVYSLYMQHDSDEVGQKDRVILHMSYLTIIFWVLRLISRTAERVSYYFIVGLYGYFSNTMPIKKDEFLDIFRWLLVVASVLLFVYRNYNVQYLFFWQGR